MNLKGLVIGTWRLYLLDGGTQPVVMAVFDIREAALGQTEPSVSVETYGMRLRSGDGTESIYPWGTLQQAHYEPA